MKTLIIVMGVAAVMTVVYGFDVASLRMFKQDLAKCSQELGGSPSDNLVEKLRCAMIKDGEMIRASGEIVKEEVLSSYEDGISDMNKLKQAQTQFNKCYDEAAQDGKLSVKERTTKILTCSLPTLDLLDKVN